MPAQFTLQAQVDEIKQHLFTKHEEGRQVPELCDALEQAATTQREPEGAAWAEALRMHYSAIIRSEAVPPWQILALEEFCKAQQCWLPLVHAYNILGIYQNDRDEFKALEYYLQAEKLAEKLETAEYLSKIYNNIAIVFLHCDDVEGYIEYIHKGYELSQKVQGDPRVQLHYLVILLSQHMSLGHREDFDALYPAWQARQEEIKAAFPPVMILTMRYQVADYIGTAQERNACFDALIEHLSADEQSMMHLPLDILPPLGRKLIEDGDQERARILLELADKWLQAEDVNSGVGCAILQVLYHEKFSDTPAQLEAYRRYRIIMEKAITYTNQQRAQSLRRKREAFNIDYELSEKHEHFMAMEQLAKMDELTQLHNRRFLERMLKTAHGNTDIERVGAIIVDVDYFKEYNDNYGHTKGDEALKAVAAALRKFSSETLVPCRFGGDEFTCVCIDQSNEEIEAYLNAVLTELAQVNVPHMFSKASDRLTISAGYANPVERTEDIAALISLADKGLYKVKEHGRNGFASIN